MSNFIYGDFVARLNEAKKRHYKNIIVKNSNKVIETLQIFYEMGIIKDFEINNDYVMVWMKYNKGRTIFRRLRVISLPRKKIYVNLVKLWKLKNKSNTSFYLISTGKGLKTDFECFLLKLGGEVLLKVEL